MQKIRANTIRVFTFRCDVIIGVWCVNAASTGVDQQFFERMVQRVVGGMDNRVPRSAVCGTASATYRSATNKTMKACHSRAPVTYIRKSVASFSDCFDFWRSQFRPKWPDEEILNLKPMSALKHPGIRLNRPRCYRSIKVRVGPKLPPGTI